MGAIAVRGEVVRPGVIEVAPGPMSDVLDRAGPTEAAAYARVVSADGYRASIPLGELHSGGIISIEQTGLRLRVIDGSTLCWNVKNVAEIELSTEKLPDDVPDEPTH